MISDGDGGFDVATVTVTVTPVNDAPIACEQSVTVMEHGGVGIVLHGSDVVTII